MPLQYVALVNYGDDSIALLQYLKTHQISVRVVSVDTGFGASHFQSRVQAGEAFAEACGFEVLRLQAAKSFQELVLTRKQFPNKKFQWCAGFLKGLTVIAWLEPDDLDANTVIILPTRRASARQQYRLMQWIEASDHFGGRRVWHPLYAHDDAMRDALVLESGLPVWGRRSLECDPCIHSDSADRAELRPTEKLRLQRLENTLGETMFPEGPIEAVCKATEKPLDTKTLFDMGCGFPYACGL